MDSNFVFQSQHEWQKSLKQRTDIISIQNLLVTVNAGTDAWSRPKQQPALISVNLSLINPFSSAITGDDLDTSTINYGTLSKNIVAAASHEPTRWLSHAGLVKAIETAVADTCPEEDMLYTSEVDVLFPKATLLGEGVNLRLSRAYDLGTHSTVLHLKNLKVAAIVGVNAHERLLKQTVIANVWIDCVTDMLSMAAHNKLEQHVVAAIENTSDRTLESLAGRVADRVISRFIATESPGASVRVRLEKPAAVPYADAPAVEIYRPTPQMDQKS